MVDRQTRVLGYKMSALGPCRFVLADESSSTAAGLLVLEADDTFSAGNAEHDAKIAQLQSMVQFGQWHNLFTNWPPSFAGRCFRQDKQYRFIIGMEQYVSTKLVPVRVRRGRISEEGAMPTDGELRQLCAVIGVLGWVSRQ